VIDLFVDPPVPACFRGFEGRHHVGAAIQAPRRVGLEPAVTSSLWPCGVMHLLSASAISRCAMLKRRVKTRLNISRAPGPGRRSSAAPVLTGWPRPGRLGRAGVSIVPRPVGIGNGLLGPGDEALPANSRRAGFPPTRVSVLALDERRSDIKTVMWPRRSRRSEPCPCSKVHPAMESVYRRRRWRMTLGYRIARCSLASRSAHMGSERVCIGATQ
jgi:hypothetical protein